MYGVFAIYFRSTIRMVFTMPSIELEKKTMLAKLSFKINFLFLSLYVEFPHVLSTDMLLFSIGLNFYDLNKYILDMMSDEKNVTTNSTPRTKDKTRQHLLLPRFNSQYVSIPAKTVTIVSSIVYI